MRTVVSLVFLVALCAGCARTMAPSPPVAATSPEVTTPAPATATSRDTTGPAPATPSQDTAPTNPSGATASGPQPATPETTAQTPQPAAPTPKTTAPTPKATTPTPNETAAVPKPAPAPPKGNAAAPKAAAAPPTLDLASLESRLRATKAIGVLTKLSLKNQIDDLLEDFKLFHQGRGPALSSLRERYDLLLLKVRSLLQDADAALARDVAASRDAIWALLVDRVRFEKLT